MWQKTDDCFEGILLKFFKFSTRCGIYFKHSYCAQVCVSHTTISHIKWYLWVSYTTSSNQERWKYLEVGVQRITGGLGDRNPHAVESRGKAPVWGSGGLRLPEAVDVCLHAFKMQTSGDEPNYFLYPIVFISYSLLSNNTTQNLFIYVTCLLKLC